MDLVKNEMITDKKAENAGTREMGICEAPKKIRSVTPMRQLEGKRESVLGIFQSCNHHITGTSTTYMFCSTNAQSQKHRKKKRLYFEIYKYI